MIIKLMMTLIRMVALTVSISATISGFGLKNTWNPSVQKIIRMTPEIITKGIVCLISDQLGKKELVIVKNK